MDVIFLKAAEHDFQAISKYYSDISDELAEDFEEDVLRAIQFIFEFPATSRELRNGTRLKMLRRFKFHFVAYKLQPDKIIVTALGHGSRKPKG